MDYPDRTGLEQASAAVREGDTSIVMTLDRLDRSIPDLRKISDQLGAKGVTLTLETSVYDLSDPMGKMFFNIVATFAEFEVDLIKLRTREGMALPKAIGKMRDKKTKLTDKQQKYLQKMRETGEHSVRDIAGIFFVSRATVYRTLQRGQKA